MEQIIQKLRALFIRLQLTLTQSRTRRVMLSINDGDVTDKRYVQQNMQILKDQQNKRKIATFQSNVWIMINEFQKMTHRAE